MPLTPALGRQRQADLSEFKVSLVYRVSSRTARDTHREILPCYIHGCHASIAEMLTGQANIAGRIGIRASRSCVFQAVPWQSVVV